MLLFDSVGHYFRLCREMLSGSRFTVLFLSPLLPTPPTFVPPSLSLFLSFLLSLSLSFSLAASIVADNRTQGRNMSSFLANVTRGSNATPLFEIRFRALHHRHSTVFALFHASAWTNNIEPPSENCLIPKYTSYK